MKLRLLLFTPCIVSMAVFMPQASAQTSPDSPPHSMQQDSQPPSLASSLNKGEKKITGCIRSENGKFLLENKTHKKVWLSGPEDIGPQVGHTVVVYGSYLNATAPAKSVQAGQKKSSDPALNSAANHQESNFQVSKVESVSDTCAINKPGSDQP